MSRKVLDVNTRGWSHTLPWLRGASRGQHPCVCKCTWRGVDLSTLHTWRAEVSTGPASVGRLSLGQTPQSHV